MIEGMGGFGIVILRRLGNWVEGSRGYGSAS